MVPQRLGALDKVSLEVDEGMELEREKQVRQLLLIIGTSIDNKPILGWIPERHRRSGSISARGAGSYG